MRLKQLPAVEIEQRLRDQGLLLRTGPVVTRLRTRLPEVASALTLLYAEHDVAGPQDFCDFDTRIDPVGGLRRWLRPQAEFTLDGVSPFKPMPLQHAAATLEWGLNWCVSSYCHQYLIIHAAAIERHGLAVVLPAPPGSGKSTLCAGLVQRGWRLLSDELCMIDPWRGELVPLARPVSLKNQSIDVIKRFAPAALFGPVTHDTIKGSVAHMQPPADSVHQSQQRARLGWVVFPRYVAGSALAATPMPRSEAFMALIDNAFNYHLHGSQGFDGLADMMQAAECLRFEYADLQQAADYFAALAASRSA